MTNAPFFSIIIPTLNEEAFLPRLLEDIAVQKDRSFEVIVVDGGSKDETCKLARAFADKMEINVFTSTVANVSSQRNEGATKARGEYLVFFDADVQIPKNYLEKIHMYLSKNPYPFVTTQNIPDSRQVYDKGIVRVINLAMEISQLIEKPFVGGYNFIVLRQVFLLLHGFRPDIKHAEDSDLGIRLHQNGYKLMILKNPKLTFSLRRFKRDGRLNTLRKNAQATIHILTKGPITSEIFSYPMGGLLYKLKPRSEIQPQILKKADTNIRRFLKLLVS